MNITQKVAAAAFTACLAFGASAAMAATRFNVQSLPPEHIPLVLLDDGRALIGRPVVYTVPEGGCPVLPSPNPFDPCPKPISQTLALVGPGQTPQDLPDNLLSRELLFNHAGQVLSWIPHLPLSYSSLSLLDVFTDVSVPFSTVNMPRPGGECPVNDPGYYQWLALSDSGRVLTQNAAGCGLSTSLTLWSGAGSQQILAPSGAISLNFGGINGSHQIAVSANITSSVLGRSVLSTKAFLWSQATGYKALPIPLLNSLAGYNKAVPVSINDAGDVLGNMSTSSVTHAVIWRGGTATDIGTLPGYKTSAAIGLTSTGQVLACAYQASSASVPDNTMFVWDKGTRQAIDKVVAPGGPAVPTQCNVAKFHANRKGQWFIHDFDGTYTYIFTPVK